MSLALPEKEKQALLKVQKNVRQNQKHYQKRWYTVVKIDMIHLVAL